MNLDRRGFLVASSSALVLGKTGLLPGMSGPPLEPSTPTAVDRAIEGSAIAVYTTADKTGLRLAATDSLTFKHMGQPLETQTCVFVDPARKFQTILGIGGALTDASAETFEIGRAHV